MSLLPLQDTKIRTSYLNRLHWVSAVTYILIISFLGILLSIFVSRFEQVRILQKSHDVTMQISTYFNGIYDNFWKVYLPVYSDDESYRSLTDFFSNPIDSIENDPFKRQKIIRVLKNMSMASDLGVRWILLFKNESQDAYLYYTGSGTIQKAPENFPFLDKLCDPSQQRILMGTESLSIPEERVFKQVESYAIAGRMISSKDGKQLGIIAIGYETARIDQIYQGSQFDISTYITIATDNGNILYSSTGNYKDIDPEKIWDKKGRILETESGSYYIENLINRPGKYLIFNAIPYRKLFLSSHRYSPLILLIYLVLASLSTILYFLTGKLSGKKVFQILDGLKKIEKNNLSYQLPVGKNCDEFDIISDHINHMTNQLQEYIDKAYIYSINCKNAELGELQAKFNPHFLYNCLEVIRAQLQKNDDLESAEMVLLLSKIFRSFIKQDSFITIQEELSLCRMYLELFQLRYRDEFEVEFDVDTEVLQYGIIRNLLQPIIENYFIHGFGGKHDYNRICISGMLLDEEQIALVVEDNGYGIQPEKLQQLRIMLQNDVFQTDDHYGLKNINDRIRIFYGKNCGIQIHSVYGEYTKIQLIIGKMTCQQHSQHMQNNMPRSEQE